MAEPTVSEITYTVVDYTGAWRPGADDRVGLPGADEARSYRGIACWGADVFN